jgi:hypothetical protein
MTKTKLKPSKTTYRGFEITAYPRPQGKVEIGLYKDIPGTDCLVACCLATFIDFDNPDRSLNFFPTAEAGFARARAVIDSKGADYFPEETNK